MRDIVENGMTPNENTGSIITEMLHRFQNGISDEALRMMEGAVSDTPLLEMTNAELQNRLSELNAIQNRQGTQNNDRFARAREEHNIITEELERRLTEEIGSEQNVTDDSELSDMAQAFDEADAEITDDLPTTDRFDPSDPRNSGWTRGHSEEAERARLQREATTNKFDDKEQYPESENILQRIDEIRDALDVATDATRNALEQELSLATAALRRRLPGGTRLNMGIDPTILTPAAKALWDKLKEFITKQNNQRLEFQIRAEAKNIQSDLSALINQTKEGKLKSALRKIRQAIGKALTRTKRLEFPLNQPLTKLEKTALSEFEFPKEITESTGTKLYSGIDPSNIGESLRELGKAVRKALKDRKDRKILEDISATFMNTVDAVKTTGRILGQGLAGKQNADQIINNTLNAFANSLTEGTKAATSGRRLI